MLPIQGQTAKGLCPTAKPSISPPRPTIIRPDTRMIILIITVPRLAIIRKRNRIVIHSTNRERHKERQLRQNVRRLPLQRNELCRVWRTNQDIVSVGIIDRDIEHIVRSTCVRIRIFILLILDDVDAAPAGGVCTLRRWLRARDGQYGGK